MINISARPLLLLLAPLIAGCAEEPSPPVPPEVVIAPAESRFFPIYGNYVAVTHPSQDVEVRARVNGFIEPIEYTEGTYVEEGDPLYRIDDRPYAARVDRLQANLDSAIAHLRKMERDVERLQPLYEENAASQLDLDTATSAREQAAAGVSAIQAELAEAKLDLEFTHVTAPISGLAGARGVSASAPGGDDHVSLVTAEKRGSHARFVASGLLALGGAEHVLKV